MGQRGSRPVVADAVARSQPQRGAGPQARAERRTVIDADGRAKAYRPMPAPERTAAVMAGLGAYAAGDFFEAHELMEPAWMGTDDPAERDLISGLIKVAAADVHAVRGNPRGVARNLEGARDRLRRVPDGDPARSSVSTWWVCAKPSTDVSRILPTTGAPTPSRSAGAADEPRSAIPTIDVAEAERRLRECIGEPAPCRCPRGQRIRGRPGARGPCSCRCRRSRPEPGVDRRTGH